MLPTTILNFPDVFGAPQKLFKRVGTTDKNWKASLLHDLFISVQLVRIFSFMLQEGEIKLEKPATTLKGKSHIAIRPEGVSLVGQNGIFVELDLKTYECSRQSTSLQRNRL